MTAQLFCLKSKLNKINAVVVIKALENSLSVRGPGLKSIYGDYFTLFITDCFLYIHCI